MTALSSWEVAQDISHARQMMDHVDNDPLFAGPHWQQTTPRSQGRGAKPALDVIEREYCFVISAAIPGVRPEDIEILLTDNVLTITGVCRPGQPTGEESYHLRERMRGAFSRRVVFPAAINAAGIEAVYENGVLDVVLPKGGVFTAPTIDVQIPTRQNGHFSQLAVITQPV